MELHLENSSQPNRFHVDEIDNTDNIEWNKKRKSQTDELDLHRPKHKCWIGNSSSESLDHDSSGPEESAKDSNSFIEDSSNTNTTMSMNEGYKLETEREYNSSYNYAHLNASENHEEHFLGLGNHTENMFSEYAKDNIEECIDKELQDIYHSKLENPNTYVLSSGRWKVNQEAQSSSRPPTIDQEFEQYFSMLML